MLDAAPLLEVLLGSAQSTTKMDANMNSMKASLSQQESFKLDFATMPSPTALANNAQHRPERPDGRFVAGNQFYNYEIYGSLRQGGAVKFLSIECLGLAAAIFSSVFSYAGLQSVLRPLLSAQLQLNKQQNLAVQRLVELPMALSLFIGLLSDCYPILGLRRKAYMIVGLALNAVAVLSIAGISSKLESEDADEEISPAIETLVILLAACASTGCMFTYLCTHTRLIELSQREPLCERGAIQATYLVFRRITQLASSCFAYIAMGAGNDSTRFHLSNSMMILALFSVAPLPLILLYWQEETYSLPCSMKVRANIFWRIMQQKAVWRVIAFIAFFTFFLGVRFNDSFNIVRMWSGATTDNAILVRSVADVVMLITVFIWRYFFINRPWRLFFCWAPIIMIVTQLVLSSLTCFDVVRDRYFFRSMSGVSAISDGVQLLENIVPLTEIIQEGSEGATVGLVLSLQRLIGLFVNTSSSNLFRGDNFYSPGEVLEDNTHVRWMVFLSLLLNYAINAVSFGGLFFLPQQKLDAQQMRMYGGFTKAASVSITIFSVIFFIYSAVINVLAFVPSMACRRAVGGEGCARP
ncbi:TPA: hypothetical protein N0F65_012852 [Lagenidium giganteum]|uniref:Transmembrane protein n=1 Tax=Lagenidium giganteum TaxID=4803 RepID=A0AAV2YLK5_9STRA|nr:TPA: hypothetical protein N0F65_012852 [Lagenidium giganteum]